MPHLIRQVGDAKPQDISCGVLRKLIGEVDFPAFDIGHVTISGSTVRHHHPKPVYEFYYILKGILKVHVDDELVELRKNSLIMFKPETSHKAWPTGKSPVELLVISCPPWRQENEILEE